MLVALCARPFVLHEADDTWGRGRLVHTVAEPHDLVTPLLDLRIIWIGQWTDQPAVFCQGEPGAGGGTVGDLPAGKSFGERGLYRLSQDRLNNVRHFPGVVFLRLIGEQRVYINALPAGQKVPAGVTRGQRWWHLQRRITAGERLVVTVPHQPSRWRRIQPTRNQRNPEPGSVRRPQCQVVAPQQQLEHHPKQSTRRTAAERQFPSGRLADGAGRVVEEIRQPLPGVRDAGQRDLLDGGCRHPLPDEGEDHLGQVLGCRLHPRIVVPLGRDEDQFVNRRIIQFFDLPKKPGDRCTGELISESGGLKAGEFCNPRGRLGGCRLVHAEVGGSDDVHSDTVHFLPFVAAVIFLVGTAMGVPVRVRSSHSPGAVVYRWRCRRIGCPSTSSTALNGTVARGLAASGPAMYR